MRVISLICSSLLVMSCFNAPNKERREIAVLEEVVLLRTEGILLVEKARKRALKREIDASCDRINDFYMDSQIDLLKLCNNKPLTLSMDSYNVTQKQLELALSESTKLEYTLVRKLILNLAKQKKVYLSILMDRELTSIHYFALHSYLSVKYFMDDLIELHSSRNLKYT